MTDGQILIKAIEKAQKNGWYSDSWHRIVPTDAVGLRLHGDGAMQLYRNGSVDETHINEVIYNHNFAKALWGDSTAYVDARAAVGKLDPRHDVMAGNGWQYHLQQMVIADDPIKYLGENI